MEGARGNTLFAISHEPFYFFNIIYIKDRQLPQGKPIIAPKI
jgi:hypothetical protein